MNRLMSKPVMVTVPKAQLLVVCGMAAAHVEDIETGIADRTYTAVNNLDIQEKSAALQKVNQVLDHPVDDQDAGEHEVSYAYPSSPLAAQLGFSKEGCFVFSKDGQTLPFAAKSDALNWATVSGTQPKRWSMDHPANQHLASAR